MNRLGLLARWSGQDNFEETLKVSVLNDCVRYFRIIIFSVVAGVERVKCPVENSGWVDILKR